MGDNEYIRVVRDGPIATVTLNRPQVHNAFNEHVVAQLKSAFDEVAPATSVRVVVLRGEGKSFSAGADLDWMRRAGSFSEEENRRDAAAAAALWRTIAECPKPVISRVHGNAYGGGAGLVAASDIAIAADTAMFGFTEVRLGLVPATVAPHVVAKIGAGRALPLFLTGERFDAQRALAIGLVHQAVAPPQLDVAVGDAVDALLMGGPYALSVCKDLIRTIESTAAAAIDAYTADLIASARSGEEGREGVQAFLQKRTPMWADQADP